MTAAIAVHPLQAESRQPTDTIVPLEKPFGDDFPNLDSLATGLWWDKQPKGQNPPPTMKVPRDQTVAFALYTLDAKLLSLSVQLYPLMPDEPREVRLEVERGDQWIEIAKGVVSYPGWDAHFRIPDWDDSQSHRYRARHGESASFEGTIRRNPIDEDTIVVASMSCNSSRTTGTRPEIINNLLKHNPDVLFFAGDQTYRHTEHTAGWIEFGLQFRDVMRDRPTITIPDDHDVGHPNLWGESGKRAHRNDGSDGGYFYPVPYVQMVERQQTSHLPPPADPTPLESGISVYFTRMRWGGVDFAILEDRKFKSAPIGNIPQMGPRPDHINDPHYDPNSIDLPGLNLLGERQHRFLQSWTEDWKDSQIKCVLSQTAFCGAVHMHGKRDDRLLADLDCNGWPQSQRKRALRELRRVRAIHLCGDQHLAVVVKHGIDEPGDGPYGFTSPALVNTIYGRWWHPLDEQPGPNAVPDSPLPWTGDYRDGLGNPIRMLAYANPQAIGDERQRADGYAIARFHKPSGTVTLECWPRFASLDASANKQFPGWPIEIAIDENDGRKPIAWLPQLQFENVKDPVVQVIDEASGEILYTVRVRGDSYHPRVYSIGSFTIRVGRDDPRIATLSGIASSPDPQDAGIRKVVIQ